MLKALQMLGLAAIAVGVGLIYVPAGIILAGIGAFAGGELLSGSIFTKAGDGE